MDYFKIFGGDEIYLPNPHATNLRLSDKYPMIFLTGEVAFPLHIPIVLAFGLIQYDTNPFSSSEEGRTDVGNSSTLTLSCDLYNRANLEEVRQIQDKVSLRCHTPINSQGKTTHLWRFTTLHCSCTAHFADQWAGQLDNLEERDWDI